MAGIAWKTRRLWLVTVLVLLSGACNRQDAERLGRIGRKAVERTEGLTGHVRDSLTTGWQSVCSGAEESSVPARVMARLRLDKSLADATIEVELKDGVIELRGQVADLPQRRRAIELAESTIGVAKVADKLQTPQAQP
jgi:osmotically-inducible protein OsmY